MLNPVMGGCGHQFTVVHRPNIEYHLCPSRSNLINRRQACWALKIFSLENIILLQGLPDQPVALICQVGGKF